MSEASVIKIELDKMEEVDAHLRIVLEILSLKSQFCGNSEDRRCRYQSAVENLLTIVSTNLKEHIKDLERYYGVLNAGNRNPES